MDLHDKEKLELDLKSLYGIFKIDREKIKQLLYSFSKDPNYYEITLLESSRYNVKNKIPAIFIYFMGCESYLLLSKDSSIRFDIFFSARVVPLIRYLAECLKVTIHLNGFEKKIKKLLTVRDSKELDSILYEIFTIHQYFIKFKPSLIEFIEETDKKTPDIRMVTTEGIEFFIEVKNPIRRSNYHSEQYKFISQLLNFAADLYNNEILQPGLYELHILIDPKKIDKILLTEAFSKISELIKIENQQFRLERSSFIPDPLNADEYQLYPSPTYYKKRANWPMEEAYWDGLKNFFKATMIGPSYIDELDSDCFIKYRIENKEYRERRDYLPFKLLFEGLEQLSKSGENTILHYVFERFTSKGHRRNTLKRLTEETFHKNFQYAAIIFNELEFAIDSDANFIFTERAHPVSTLNSNYTPIVKSIFNFEPSEIIEDDGEWGIGAD
ncbi:hypothetical protein EHQ19_08365 [Leptospira montravelensis]|uniref:hypothetical protein n=1 Tax=Leptospira montravelensis TaxID=2484961 RepID=UPI0010830891|nr:hypothetical protein [Leptospira montravelensis]TGK82706.1 hypothetical protein EHQ19_08365 [Leptospira montravelensis]